MAKSEYLVFIPLLFYGFALAELFKEWKRLFKPKDIYLPYIIMTVILTETAIYNVFIMTKLLDDLEHQNYINYLIYLIPPFILMLVVNVFTPEKEDNTEVYFENNRRSFFLLTAVFVASHYLFDFGESIKQVIGRAIVTLFLVFIAFNKSKWPIYLLGVFWLILSIFRLELKAF